jgi:hypothetical protein
MAQTASEVAFRSRVDLKGSFKANARLLFALQTKFQIEDIESVGAECITCGSDDKKCDLVYVNKDDGFAVVAQAYEASEPKESAPSNKAADLNTAMSWLLNNNWSFLPDRLKSAAEQLQNAIKNNQITHLYVWYVHNFSESPIVKNELQTVERTAKSALTANFPGAVVEIQATEVGTSQLEEWYQAISAPILVSRDVFVHNVRGYEMNGDNWDAFVASIPATLLYELFEENRTKLFSANIRDYLGSRESDANINNNIKKTAESDPKHFWIYNNGLTALVNDYELQGEDGKPKTLKISGISIVNGAQTTGAIGSLGRPPDPIAFVPIRFVKSANQDVILGIIRYNNSQNKIKASDFRSNDPIQSRLRTEFELIRDAKYYGGRRGSAQDIIRRTPNLLPSDTVAQTIASFHGNPADAYNRKADLWEEDKQYSAIFNEHVHASHIVFVYSLLKCIEEYKLNLRQKESEKRILDNEKKISDFFRNRGATFLLHSAIASCMELIVNQPVPNKFVLSFGQETSLQIAIENWAPVVRIMVPFCSSLEPAVHDSIQSKDDIKKAVEIFRGYIAGLTTVHETMLKTFADKCILQ